MNCPHCGFEQEGTNTECPRCGIVFAKYRHSGKPSGSVNERRDVRPALDNVDPVEGEKGTLFRRMWGSIVHVDDEANIVYFIGRSIAYILFVIWGFVIITKPLASNYVGMSFMHNINLPFHEAGHIFFRPFGRFITVLGGSLMQLLVPALVLFVFLRKKNPFGASIGLWWLGESAMDLAPYINDARALRLILLGGVTGRDVADYHDWEYILRALDMKSYDHIIAGLAYGTGIVMILLSFVWGGFILFRQIRRLDW